jgi:hypothetical protein
VPEGTRLRLVPAAGARINAQQRPALQRADSSVVLFDSPSLTTDSAYFTEPPEALVTGPTAGRIVASVCPSGEYVCRPVIFDIPLTWAVTSQGPGRSFSPDVSRFPFPVSRFPFSAPPPHLEACLTPATRTSRSSSTRSSSTS